MTSIDSLLETLMTVRTRRIGQGYRLDSDTVFEHPVTGRSLSQAGGPHPFVSEEAPVPLTAEEEAILAWAACGPNGVVTWDLSGDGGFHELASLSGRTAPHPGNSGASSLVVINDDGVWLHSSELPDGRFDGPVELALACYDDRIRLSDERPDIDWGLRFPSMPDASLMGPYQGNVNMPGSSWFVPIVDVGRIFSSLVVFFADWRHHFVDEFNGGRSAGLQPWVDSGLLQLAVPISALEQRMLQIETFPAGAIVQNVRLVAESMGLGTWPFCGYVQEVLLGAFPTVATGLAFDWEFNADAPVATGAMTCLGRAPHLAATTVPSPTFPDARTLVAHWRAEKDGPGAWRGPDGGDAPETPWDPAAAAAVRSDPVTSTPEWAWEAAEAFVGYCVETFGRWPVTINPMHAQFSVVAHHLDPAFYDRYYRDGTLTARHHDHGARWHGGAEREP